MPAIRGLASVRRGRRGGSADAEAVAAGEGTWQRDREDAFRLLDAARLTQAYRLATLILRDPDGAEDAVQESIVRAWSSWATLRDLDRFDAWFDRILVNTCRNRLRRARTIRFVPLDEAFEAAAVDGAPAAIDRIALERAFARLTPDQRVVVVLRIYRDLTIDQIADRVGIPAGTVKSRLHHALRALRDALTDAAADKRGRDVR